MDGKQYLSLEAAVSGCFGQGTRILHSAWVGGGDINEARRLTLSNGAEVFVKSNRRENSRFFETEEQGLHAIAAARAIQTPRVLCRGVDGESAFLMLEMVRSGRKISRFWEIFGQELAAMHRADTGNLVPGGRFGFAGDNYIGASPQCNSPAQSWVDFFRRCRLRPQFHRARHYLDAGLLRRARRLLDHLEEYLVEPSAPALLHGDLWSGNFLVGGDGRAWLIDPAVYVGHAEADLAMTELFGGFSGEFYGAYREVNPLEPGYEDRRDLYNLYHLLNHLNLFGAGYLGAVKAILSRYS